MSERKNRFLLRLFPWLLVFVVGFVAGFRTNERRHHERLQQAVEDAREEVYSTSLEAIERARRAGTDLSEGAQAAADSARAAFGRLLGGSGER